MRRSTPIRRLLPCVLFALAIACGSGGGSADGKSTSVASGEELYVANCTVCHGTDQGGNIKDIPPPHNANGHTWHHPDQQLSGIILNGLDFAVEGQQTMPAFGDQLSTEQVHSILSYIKTWWTEDQRSFQSQATAGAVQIVSRSGSTPDGMDLAPAFELTDQFGEIYSFTPNDGQDHVFVFYMGYF